MGGVNHTVFGDLRQRATAVLRVQTQASVYIIGFHEARGRRFVIARGEPGGDREHVVVRDSDPRVGEHSMFELPLAEWPGKLLEIATMVSSPVVAVAPEREPALIAAVGVDGKLEKSPWAKPEAGHPAGSIPFKSPRPGGMPDTPVIVPGRARGTNPAAEAVVEPGSIARQVVVGQAAPPARAPAEPELPYPQRHVKYAESCASLLRSLSRRDRLFEDLAGNKALRDTLRRSLDDCAVLLEQIRRRDRR